MDPHESALIWVFRSTGRSAGEQTGLLAVSGVAQLIEQVAGREDLDAGVRVVLVLGPDWELQLQRERDGRPVVGIAGSDALFGLLTVVLVLARGLPVDRHDLERREQQRRVQVALGCEAGDVTGYLSRDDVCRDASWSVRGGDHQAGTAADEG
jgi:hypothetical protein